MYFSDRDVTERLVRMAREHSELKDELVRIRLDVLEGIAKTSQNDAIHVARGRALAIGALIEALYP